MNDALEWILKLKDEVTKPLHEIKASLSVVDQGFKKNEKNIDLVGNSISELRTKLERYKQGRDEAFRTDHIRKYNQLIDVTEQKLKELENLPPKKHQQNWAAVAFGINQTFELAEKLASAFDFTKELRSLTVEVKRFTNGTDEEVNKIVTSAHRIAKVFNQDEEEIVRAANSMTKQIGGTFEENLALIQAGFEKGANLNGDMLDQLKEYGPQIKALGLDASKTIAIMSQAGKEGVFSDKAIDALKEANLSLREMGQAQIDALNGIGLSVEDLAGKTTFEAVQMISNAMQGASTQAKQLVLADIFKGAGEDAGLKFIQGLNSVDMDINNIPSVKQSGATIKGWLANIESWFSQTFGNFGGWISNIAQIGTGLAGLISVYNSLASSEAIVTAAQWVLNAAMNAFPLVGIVTLVIAAVGLIIAYWDDLKEYFVALVDFWLKYLNPFAWLIELIDFVFPGAKKAIVEFFSSVWDWIYNNFIQPLVEAWDWIKGAFGFGDKEVKGEINVNKNDNVNVTTDNQQGAETLQFNNDGTKSLNKTTQQKSGGSAFSNAEKKNINVSIDKLVDKIVINTQNMQESAAKIRDMVSEALVAAVRDSEVAIS